MSVAAHLGIVLEEYDARIRTFIPDYQEMLDVAAGAVPTDARRIVDLGTGTGALASRCLARARRARLVGIDSDPDILRMAVQRLGSRASFISGSFLEVELPACDTIVASFALHHVRTRHAKGRLYQRFRKVLVRGGRFVGVDCHPSPRPALAREQMAAWARHLRGAYSPAESRKLLNAWGHEDTYVPLAAEVGLMEAAGFRVDILWRKGAFAVLIGSRQS